MNRKSDRKALLAAFFCNFFWGLSFMASRIAMDTAPVVVLLSHRFLLAVLVMSILLLLRRAELHLKGRSLLPLLLLGLMQPVIYFIGEQYGILHSTTIFSGVMISIIPVAGILAAIPVLHEVPTARQMFFILLSVGGVIGIGMMSKSSGSLDWIGIAGLLVAISAAVIYTLLNRNIAATYSAFERTYVMMAVGACIFTILAAATVKGDPAEYLRPLSSPGYIVSLLYLGVFCSVICFFLSCYSLSTLSVARATVFANLTTTVSVLAGAIILHEPLSHIGILCCVLILVGIYGVQQGAEKAE